MLNGRTILGISPIFALLGLMGAGCDSSPGLAGDWVRCGPVDCTEPDAEGIRLGMDRTWQRWFQKGRSIYSPELEYCVDYGEDDSGTYQWDGVNLSLTDHLGRVDSGSVELPDEVTMRFTMSSGRSTLFKRIRPTRATGSCN